MCGVKHACIICSVIVIVIVIMRNRISTFHCCCQRAAMMHSNVGMFQIQMNNRLETSFTMSHASMSSQLMFIVTCTVIEIIENRKCFVCIYMEICICTITTVQHSTAHVNVCKYMCMSCVCHVWNSNVYRASSVCESECI